MGSPSIVVLASSHHVLLCVVPPSFSRVAGETRFLLPLCPGSAYGERSDSEDGGAESVSGFSPKPQKKSFVYTIDSTPQTPRWG